MTPHYPLPAGEDLGAIARQLEALAGRLRGKSFIPVEREQRDETIAAHSPSYYVQLARQIYANRRRRNLAFANTDIFGEPAWDILLDLYVAQAEGRLMSVSSACIGSAAPPTTGLRWLGVLQQEGLVLREHDPQDQRRILVRLSPDGTNRMEDYLRKISRMTAPDLPSPSQRCAETGVA